MALFVDLVALSNGLHGSVQMDSVALFSWIGWLRHHGILNYPYIEKSNRISILFSSIDSFLIIIFQSIMIIFCGIKILKGSMTIGNFTMINMYFNLFVKNFKKIIDCVKNYPDAQVSYNRIVELERKKEFLIM